MDKDAFLKRRDELLEEESHRPLTWWWLSFVNDGKFAGTCIVEARGFVSAMAITHLLGINPGGQIRFQQIPEAPDTAYINRLLTREEAEGLGGRRLGDIAKE